MDGISHKKNSNSTGGCIIYTINKGNHSIELAAWHSKENREEEIELSMIFLGILLQIMPGKHFRKLLSISTNDNKVFVHLSSGSISLHDGHIVFRVCNGTTKVLDLSNPISIKEATDYYQSFANKVRKMGKAISARDKTMKKKRNK